MPAHAPDRVTLARLAQHLGLSATTVSLVLNGRGQQVGIAPATAARIRQQAQQLGYRPSISARQLRGKRSNAVGMLISTEAVADRRLVQALERLAAARDLRIIIGHAVGSQAQVDAYLDDFQARGVDGLVSIFHNHPDYAHRILPRLMQFERVVFYEPPAVVPPRLPQVAQACSVTPDYYACGRLAVEHLVARGRRRIALVMHNLVFPYAHARRRAHEDALTAAGQEFDERRVWILDHQPGMRWQDPFTPEQALRAVDELVARQGADAIVAITDYYAARILAALHQRGIRVPDDVAVIGSDDFELGTMLTPALTTIDLHIDRLAEALAGQLFDLLDHGAVPEERRALVIPPTLIVRQST